MHRVFGPRYPGCRNRLPTCARRGIVKPDGQVVSRGEGHRDPHGLAASRDRHPGPEDLPQGRRPGRRSASRKRASRSGCALGAGGRCEFGMCDRRAPESSSAWRAAGNTGARSTATSRASSKRVPDDDEMCAMLARQIGAAAHLEWFNRVCIGRTVSRARCKATYHVDPKTGEPAESRAAYDNPASMRAGGGHRRRSSTGGLRGPGRWPWGPSPGGRGYVGTAVIWLVGHSGSGSLVSRMGDHGPRVSGGWVGAVWGVRRGSSTSDRSGRRLSGGVRVGRRVVFGV